MTLALRENYWPVTHTLRILQSVWTKLTRNFQFGVIGLRSERISAADLEAS
jgi:hypothetical protein